MGGRASGFTKRGFSIAQSREQKLLLKMKKSFPKSSNKAGKPWEEDCWRWKKFAM